MPELDAPVNNTPYSDQELQHFKKLLEEEKKEAQQEIDNLKESAEDIGANDDDVSSAQDHHYGNIATEEEEKETFYTLIKRQKDKIKQVNAALDRIERKTYGVCQETGKKIQKERLEAKPYAQYCIEAKRSDDSVNQPPKV